MNKNSYFKWGPEIHPKSMKNEGWAIRFAFLCSLVPQSPRIVQWILKVPDGRNLARLLHDLGTTYQNTRPKRSGDTVDTAS